MCDLSSGYKMQLSQSPAIGRCWSPSKCINWIPERDRLRFLTLDLIHDSSVKIYKILMSFTSRCTDVQWSRALYYAMAFKLCDVYVREIPARFLTDSYNHDTCLALPMNTSGIYVLRCAWENIDKYKNNSTDRLNIISQII